MPEDFESQLNNPKYISKLKGRGISPAVKSGDIDGNYEYITDENGERIKVIYIKDGNIINPNTLKSFFAEFMNNEFNRYTKLAYYNTCDEIDNQIESHKEGLGKHLTNKIDKVTNEIFEDFTSSKIFKKFEKSIENKLIELHDRIATDMVNNRFQGMMKQSIDRKLKELELKIIKKQ